MPLRRSARNANKTFSESEAFDPNLLTLYQTMRPLGESTSSIDKSKAQQPSSLSAEKPSKTCSVRQSNKRTRKASAKKTNNRPRRKSITSRPQSRPQVISLDVTTSESEDSDVEEIFSASPPKASKVSNKKVQNKLSRKKKSSLKSHSHFLWPSVRMRDGRCTISSDSDDDEMVPITSPKQKKIRSTTTSIVFSSDLESDNDPYAVHYEEGQLKALQMVKDTLKRTRRKSECDSQLSGGNLVLSPSKISDTEDYTENINYKCIDIGSGGEEVGAVNSSLDLNLDKIDVSSIVLRGSAERPSRTRTTKKAIAVLQEFSKRYEEEIQQNAESVDDSYNDDVIISDDCSSDIRIRVFWGLEYTRHSIHKNSKFATLYQEIAEKHKVSVSEVVLSFKDSIISSEERPVNIGLSIGDIIEGGILNQTNEKCDKTDFGNDENSLSLKVQTSNRKIFHFMQINKYDKMSVLMENYAKLRNIPSHKLKFKFDGETLLPTDTPSSLEFEGGECLDVFEL